MKKNVQFQVSVLEWRQTGDTINQAAMEWDGGMGES